MNTKKIYAFITSISIPSISTCPIRIADGMGLKIYQSEILLVYQMLMVEV